MWSKSVASIVTWTIGLETFTYGDGNPHQALIARHHGEMIEFPINITDAQLQAQIKRINKKQEGKII